MHQKVTPTLFSVHLVDRSRNCACDCTTIEHKHSLIRIFSKEARSQNSSPTGTQPPLADSFTGQTTATLGSHSQHTTSPPYPQSICSSPTSAFPGEKISCTPWDSATESTPSPGSFSSHSPLSPRSPIKQQFVQPRVPSPHDNGVQTTSTPLRRRCRRLLGRLKMKMRFDFRDLPMVPDRQSHVPVEMNSQESVRHELPTQYNCPELYSGHTIEPPTSPSYGCVPALAELAGVGASLELPTDQDAGQPSMFHDAVSPGTMRVSNHLNNLLFGGANDFPTDELFPSPAPYRALTLPEAQFQSERNLAPSAQPPNLSHMNTVSHSYRYSLQNSRPRSPGHPTLTLQTNDIQANISSSRRPSWQGSISSGVPSQFTGTTPSSGHRTTPFSSTFLYFGTPFPSNPPSELNPPSAGFSHGIDTWSPKNMRPCKQSDHYAFSPDISGLSGSYEHVPSYSNIFSDASPNPSPTTTGNAQPALMRRPLSSQPARLTNRETLVPAPLRPSAPISHSSAPPAPTRPPPLQQRPLPTSPPSSLVDPPDSSNTNSETTAPRTSNAACPRCNRPFTSKPRDFGRNLRRHLSLACPNRDVTDVPRLTCSFGLCGKTFARDCARRVHEKKQHGFAVGLSRSNGRGRRGGVSVGAGGAGVGGVRRTASAV